MAKATDMNLRVFIGRKLALARNLANLKQEEVMISVFGVSSDSKQKNRISEIENARTLPDCELLHVLCSLYGVSSDWILGFTLEPQVDKNHARAELLFNRNAETLGDLFHALTAKVTAVCAEKMNELPNSSMLQLLHDTKNFLHIYTENKDLKDSISFQAALVDMRTTVRECERTLAIQERDFDMAMGNIFQRDDNDEHEKMVADLIGSRIKRFPPTTLMVQGKDFDQTGFNENCSII